MATTAPEDFDKISELQANAKRALDRWDETDVDQKSQVFGAFVPLVNELVAAQEKVLRAGELRATVRRRRLVGGGALLAVAAIALAFVIVGGWNWVAVIVLVLASGIGFYLLRGGGGRD